MSKKTKKYYEENQRLKKEINNIIAFHENSIKYCQRILKRA
jgi:hypothetical protein